MNEPEELLKLREEIHQMLANAVAVKEQHMADIARRDELHVAEMNRRDELHTSETQRRSDVHAHELEVFRRALDSRDVIGQAKGIIMATMLCSADEAFQLLTKQSQVQNRKLVEVAAEIAARTARGHTPG